MKRKKEKTERRHRRAKRRRLAAAAGGGGRDRISGLPESILGAILSLLPLDEAARTAALSSQWRHVWSNSPLILSIDRFMIWRFGPVFPAVLSRHSDSAAAGVVSIDYFSLSESECRSLVSLFGAFEGKHIESLAYGGASMSPDTRVLPQCLLSGGTLAEMWMGNCWFQDPAAALLSLRHLKELRMNEIPDKKGKDFSSVISGLPMLASLDLCSLHKLSDFHIQSRSLERLYLSHVDGDKLTIDAPNLQELGIRYMPTLWMNLHARVSELSKLRCLKLEYLKDVTSLHIRSMSLQRLCMEEVSPVQDPVVHAPNLTHLIIGKMAIPGEYIENMLLRFPKLCILKLYGPTHFDKFHITSETLRYIYLGVRVEIEKDLLIDAPLLHKVYIDSCGFACTKFINSPRIKNFYYLSSHLQVLELGDAIFKDADVSCNNPILGIKKLIVNVCNLAPSTTQPHKFFKCFPCLERLHIRELRSIRDEKFANGEEVQEDLRHEKEGGHLLNHLMYFKLHLGCCQKSTVRLVHFIISQAKSLQRMRFVPHWTLCQQQEYLEFLSDIRKVVGPKIMGD